MTSILALTQYELHHEEESESVPPTKHAAVAKRPVLSHYHRDWSTLNK